MSGKELHSKLMKLFEHRNELQPKEIQGHLAERQPENTFDDYLSRNWKSSNPGEEMSNGDDLMDILPFLAESFYEQNIKPSIQGSQKSEVDVYKDVTSKLGSLSGGNTKVLDSPTEPVKSDFLSRENYSASSEASRIGNQLSENVSLTGSKAFQEREILSEPEVTLASSEFEVLRYIVKKLGITDIRALKDILEQIDLSKTTETETEEEEKRKVNPSDDQRSDKNYGEPDVPSDLLRASPLIMTKTKEAELTDHPDIKPSDQSAILHKRTPGGNVVDMIFSSVSLQESLKDSEDAQSASSELPGSKNSTMNATGNLMTGLDKRMANLKFSQKFSNENSSRENPLHEEKYASGQLFLEAAINRMSMNQNRDSSQKLQKGKTGLETQEREIRERSRSVGARNKTGPSLAGIRPTSSLSDTISEKEQNASNSEDAFFDNQVRKQNSKIVNDKKKVKNLPELEPFFPDDYDSSQWITYNDSYWQMPPVRYDSRRGASRGAKGGNKDHGGRQPSMRNFNKKSHPNKNHKNMNKPMYGTSSANGVAYGMDPMNPVARPPVLANLASMHVGAYSAPVQGSEKGPKNEDIRALRDGLIQANDSIRKLMCRIQTLEEDNERLCQRNSFYERKHSSMLFLLNRDIQLLCKPKLGQGGLLWSADMSLQTLAAVQRAEIQPWQESPTYFFPNSDGYAMVMEFYPCGFGKGRGSHISVYFRLLPSKNDALLRWPFPARVTFILLPATNEASAIYYTTKICSSKASMRPQSGNISDVNDGWGAACFATKALVLSSNYSKNGRVTFRMHPHM